MWMKMQRESSTFWVNLKLTYLLLFFITCVGLALALPLERIVRRQYLFAKYIPVSSSAFFWSHQTVHSVRNGNKFLPAVKEAFFQQKSLQLINIYVYNYLKWCVIQYLYFNTWDFVRPGHLGHRALTGFLFCLIFFFISFKKIHHPSRVNSEGK